MRVLVIGANGRIGRRVVKKLKTSEHEPIAMVRSTDQIPFFEKLSVPTVLGDLEGFFEHAFEDIDAVIFAAGTPPGADAVRNLSVDQEGAIKAIDLAERFQIKRFIMMSVKNADQPYYSSFEKAFTIAKHRADEYLRNSSLNYTIVRPCRLTDQEPTGHVHLQAHIPEDCEVSRGDVAEVLVELIGRKGAEKQEFDLQNGTVKIENILK